jgi:hypothetical protein
MKMLALPCLIALVAAPALTAQKATPKARSVTISTSSRERFTEEAREPVQKTVAFSSPAGEKSLKVDNILGSLELRGGTGTEVRISGERILRAGTKEDLELARREVTLDTSEKANAVEVRVNGPFRKGEGQIEMKDPKYQVAYELKLDVPERMSVVLRTVSGAITVTNLDGKLKVGTVNGKVLAQGLAGSADISTVNGGVEVVFRTNPREASTFKTVNGSLKATFPPNLGAEVSLSTVHGDILTDFPESVLTRVGDARKEGGAHVIRLGGTQKLKVGAGGPALSLHTVNGTVTLAQGK